MVAAALMGSGASRYGSEPGTTKCMRSIARITASTRLLTTTPSRIRFVTSSLLVMPLAVHAHEMFVRIASCTSSADRAIERMVQHCAFYECE